MGHRGWRERPLVRVGGERTNFLTHSAITNQAAVDPAVGREVGPSVGPRVGPKSGRGGLYSASQRRLRASRFADISYVTQEVGA